MEGYDSDKKGEDKGDVTPPPTEAAGSTPRGGSDSNKGQSDRDESPPPPSSAKDDNFDSDDGAEAKAVKSSNDVCQSSKNDDEEPKCIDASHGGASLLGADIIGSKGEGQIGTKKGAASDAAALDQNSDSKYSSTDDCEGGDSYEAGKAALAMEDRSTEEENGEENSEKESNYFPESWDVDEEDGIDIEKASPRSSGGSTHFPVEKHEGGLGLQEAHRSMGSDVLDESKGGVPSLDPAARDATEHTGLGYSGKVVETAADAILSSSKGGLGPHRRELGELEDDGLVEKVVAVDPSLPDEEEAMPHGLTDRAPLAADGAHPEIAATPGPNIGPSMVASPREVTGADFLIPAGAHRVGDEHAATGGYRDPVEQTLSPTSGAVSVPGSLSSDDFIADADQDQAGNDFATTTPIDAEVVTDEETPGLGRQQGGRRNYVRGALDPDETVYEGVSIPKKERTPFTWDHFSRNKTMFGLLFVVVCIIVVGIAVPISLDTRYKSTATSATAPPDPTAPKPSVDPTPKPSVAPTLMPSAPPTTTAPTSRMSLTKSILLEAAEDASINTTAEALKNEESPQHKALEWLLNEDEQFWGMDHRNHFIQRFALATFYFATGGNESWYNKCSFLSNITECEWVNGRTGVSCAEDNQTVNGLNFYFNELAGTIPDELGLLVGLKELRLNENDDLHGTLPPGLANLGNLEILRLGWSSLNGTLPFFTDLPNLQEVSLEYNDFSGTLPPGLFMAPNMTSFELSWNQFSGTLPTEIGKLSSLQDLRLEHNEFSGQLPSTIGALTNLYGLWLYKNQFSGQLPTNIGALTELPRLELYDNQFSGILPSSIGALTKLRYGLDLGRNRFAGPLPSSIGALTKLSDLFLHQNRFTGSIPKSFANLTELRYLILSRNKLTGTIPDIFTNMTNLRALFLDINEFKGSIPPSLASVLEYLRGPFSFANTSIAGNMRHLCNNRSNYDSTWIADCYGNNPEVICDCCNVCCSDYEDSSNLTTGDLGGFFRNLFGNGKLPGCFRV